MKALYSMVKVAKLSPLLMAFIMVGYCQGQDLLQQSVNIEVKNVSVEQALDELSNQTGIKFSYNPQSIQQVGAVSLRETQTPLSVILDEILGSSMNYKVRGSYVIIQPDKSDKETAKQKFQVKGAIVDANTRSGISDVTIYEVNKLSSTLSQDDGSYNLTVSAREDFAVFAISKLNYQDTVVRLMAGLTDLSQIALKRIETDQMDEEVGQKGVIKSFVGNKARTNASNVAMVEERDFQLALLPVAGTNGPMGGRVKNKVSINIVAGYSYGLDGLEIGGFMNVNRKDANGVQLSGFGNFAGGYSKGVQMAGGFNSNVESVDGWQVAGAINLTDANLKGVQIGGVSNFAVNVDGIQISGFTNYARRRMNGLQITGFANVNLESLNGVQISGFYNHARVLKGVQLGIFNYAKRIEKGVAIGIISWVGDGLHQVEVQSTEVLPVNFVVRTGTKTLYNILGVGYKPWDSKRWGYSYGLGTQLSLGQHLFTNFEIVATAIGSMGKNNSIFNQLNSANLALGYRLSDHWSFNAGPVYRVYTIADPESSLDVSIDLGQRGFYESTTHNTLMRMWVGVEGGLAFNW